MALTPLFSGVSHLASLQRCRPPAVSAAAGRESKQARKAGNSHGSSANNKQLVPQHRRAGRQHAAAADAEPLASADPLTAGGNGVSPPETDAATPAEAPQPRRGRKSKADKYKSAIPVRTDSERSVAAITSILGGLQQTEAEQAAAAAQAEEAAARQQAEALAVEQAAVVLQAEAQAADQQLASQQEAEAAAAQPQTADSMVLHDRQPREPLQADQEAQQQTVTDAAAAEQEAAAEAAAIAAQQAADADAAAHWDKLHQWERDKIMDKAVYRASAQPNYEEQARLQKAKAVAKHAQRIAQKGERPLKKKGFHAGAEAAEATAIGAQQADAVLAEQQRVGQQEAEAAAAEQRHLLEEEAADAEELCLRATTDAAAAAQATAPASAFVEPAVADPRVWEPVSAEPWHPGSEQALHSSTGGSNYSAGSGSGNGNSTSRDGGRGTPRRQPLRPKAKWQPPDEAPPWQGRSSGSGGGRYAPPLDADIEARQRQIHIKVMKKWRDLKDQDLGQEERTAHMKKALWAALKSQQRLNRAADDAAVAAGFEPPSALSWTERFRLRKAAINEHYRQRMEAVTATSGSSRHAESRGIPAVCTALAGVRLLHLEIEQEARAAGMAVPHGLTLDAQWAVEDQLSGEVSKLIDTAAVPSTEPQSFVEELGGIAAAMFGRASRKRRQNAAPASPAATGVRVVHETAGSPLHQEFAQLLKEAAMLSETWSRQYEEFFARKELTKRGRERKANGSSSTDGSPSSRGSTASGSSSEDSVNGSASSGTGGATRSTVPISPGSRKAATAPSTGHVLQQMWGGIFGGRRDAAGSASPGSAPGAPPVMQVTAGGGVVYQPKSVVALPRQQQPGSAAPRVQAMLQWKAKTLAEQPKFFSPTRQREQELFELGYRRVAGIDDSGAGSAAGPIIAAACIMPLDVNIRGIRDSKALNAVEREQVFAELVRHPQVAYSTYIVESFVVDEVGAGTANMVAMAGAWRNLAAAQPDFVLLDGGELPKGLETVEASLAVPQGDRSDYIIAAASIIATVTRAHIMEQYAHVWPQYGFDGNWGHLDDTHKTALKEHGMSPVHRLGERVNFLSSGMRLRWRNAGGGRG